VTSVAGESWTWVAAHELLGPAFDAGFVLDAIEAPTFW